MLCSGLHYSGTAGDPSVLCVLAVVAPTDSVPRLAATYKPIMYHYVG